MTTAYSHGYVHNGRQELDTSQNWDQTAVPAIWDQSFAPFMHLRTIDLGYGRNLFSTDALRLYEGIHYCKIFGIGLLDQKIESGSYRGFSAFSSFYDIAFADIRQPGTTL